QSTSEQMTTLTRCFKTEARSTCLSSSSSTRIEDGIHLVSSGKASIRDCVVLDEMNKLAFVNAEEMVGKLKDYLVDGFFERGPKKANAKASIVFMGNMEFRGSSWTTVAPEPHEVINALPAFMRDSAMLDRIHCFVPGWELP